jgi:tungstate transport system ATP-binding protein
MGLRLEASRISKTYNGNPVLKECSYAFDSGKTYALLGHNGTGKSTLLRILALLEKCDSGRVAYLEDGDLIKDDIKLRRRITLVLPKVGVFNTTVFKNVAYGLKLRGVAKSEIKDKVNNVLARVGLTPQRWQRAVHLSSGETKRLGIARALVIDPEVIFLDEPTANIDPENTAIIEEIVTKMKSERKATIIMITHDPAQAERLGDHLLWLQDGKIVSRQG